MTDMSQYIMISSSSLEYKTKYDIKLYLKDVFGSHKIAI